MGRLLRALRTKVAVGAKDAGMSTAEYCVGIIAVCAFAALLYKVLTGPVGTNLLDGFLARALEYAKI
jgi:hypothetical protein